MPSVNIVYSSWPSVGLPGKLYLGNQGNKYISVGINLMLVRNKIIMLSLYSHVKRQESKIKLSEYSQEEPDFRVICMSSPLYRRSGSVHRDFSLRLLTRVDSDRSLLVVEYSIFSFSVASM